MQVKYVLIFKDEAISKKRLPGSLVEAPSFVLTVLVMSDCAYLRFLYTCFCVNLWSTCNCSYNKFEI